MTAAAYVDAKGTFVAWLNSLTTTLVGPGHPIPLGAHFTRLRGSFKGAYVLPSVVGGDNQLSFGSRARISASIFGLKVKDTDDAAVAFANALLELAKGNTAMTGATCLMVADITGPIDLNLGDEERRLVDFDLYLVPA